MPDPSSVPTPETPAAPAVPPVASPTEPVVVPDVAAPVSGDQGAPVSVSKERPVDAKTETLVAVQDPSVQAAADALRSAGIPVDVTDPGVTLLVWGIVQGGRKLLGENAEKIRTFLPLIVLLVAIGLRVGADSAQGHAIDQGTLFRALAAAGVATLAHSQLREGQKARRPKVARAGTRSAQGDEKTDEKPSA